MREADKSFIIGIYMSQKLLCQLGEEGGPGGYRIKTKTNLGEIYNGEFFRKIFQTQ